MTRLADILPGALDVITTKARPWESLGEQRDTLLNLLWVELKKEKPKIKGLPLQPLEFDLLYAILKVIPEGEHKGQFSHHELIEQIGLERGTRSSRRLTFSLKRLYGSVIWFEWIGDHPLRITVPYLMTDIRLDSPEHRSLTALAYDFDLPELQHELYKARLIYRDLHPVATDPAKKERIARILDRSQPTLSPTHKDGTWKTAVQIPESERYQRYLASREWAVLKRQVKIRSGGICERCRINASVAVHHLTYARKYHEDMADLQDICQECHDFLHAKSDGDPLGGDS